MFSHRPRLLGEAELLPYIRAREALDRVAPTHHRRTWSPRELAITDLMAALGVQPTVVSIRAFLNQQPHLQLERSLPTVALKMRENKTKNKTK